MCLDERNTDSRTRPGAACLTLRRPGGGRVAQSGPLISTSHVLLLLLAFLTEDVLVDVFHALALIGLGRAETADLGGDLTHLLLIDTGHDDFGRLRRRDGDALWDRVIDVVREAELQVERLALHGRSETDAVDLQLLLEALGHAGDQIVHQGARGAPL